MKSTLIVAGLGRCGTTAIMRELDAAGFPVVGDAPRYEPDIDPLGPVPAGAFKWTSLEWWDHAGFFTNVEPDQRVSVLWMFRRNVAEWRKSFIRRAADKELISLSPRMVEEWGRFCEYCAEGDLGVASELVAADKDGFPHIPGDWKISRLAFEDLLANPSILENYFPGRGYQWGQEIRKRSSRVPKVPLELELLRTGPPSRYLR